MTLIFFAHIKKELIILDHIDWSDACPHDAQTKLLKALTTEPTPEKYSAHTKSSHWPIWDQVQLFYVDLELLEFAILQGGHQTESESHWIVCGQSHGSCSRNLGEQAPMKSAT